MDNLTLSPPSPRLKCDWGLLKVEQSALIALALFGVLAVTIERIWLSFSLPFWLDETWTAVIASQPSWALFWREAWLDCNAPLYYLVEKLWVSAFGTSNVVMRLPSAAFLYLAAALPMIWRSHGLGRKSTMVWAVLLLLWWPGIMISLDARAYGLLLFLSVSSLIAFTQVYRQISPESLALWSAISSLQVMTHYYAYFLLATQGLLLLWRWRTALIRYCYALLPFLPAVAWTLYHLPRLADYTRPDVVWYEPTTLESASEYIIYTFGAPSPFFAVTLAFALGGALWKSGWKLSPPPAKEALASSPTRALYAAIAAGVMALALILIASTFQASLADRYLVPLVPTMLLAVVCLAKRIPRSDLAYTLLVLVYMIYALTPGPLKEELESRSFYGYERPSKYIAAADLTDLVFVWDHPAAKVLDRRSLEQVGGFFLHRDGIAIRTHALKMSEQDDPNTKILDAVSNNRTGIVWLYNAQRRSAAKDFPPTIQNDPAWECLDHRSYRENPRTLKSELAAGVLACRPAAATGGAK